MARDGRCLADRLAGFGGIICALLALNADAGAVAAVPPPTKPTQAPWCLRRPGAAPVPFRGMLGTDADGTGPGAMLYVAPDPITALAEIATHAAVSSHLGNRREAARVAAANRVLIPYQAVLDKFFAPELVEGALTDPVFADKPPPLCDKRPADDQWSVETAALFSMTQDQQSLVVVNLVSLFAPPGNTAGATAVGKNENPPVAVRKQMVKVVADPMVGDDLISLWNNNDGELLKAVSEHLLAQSLDIAVKSAAASGDVAAPYKTYRYREGGIENMERARLVSATEERLLVETLRGWLLSIPAATPDAPP